MVVIGTNIRIQNMIEQFLPVTTIWQRFWYPQTTTTGTTTTCAMCSSCLQRHVVLLWSLLSARGRATYHVSHRLTSVSACVIGRPARAHCVALTTSTESTSEYCNCPSTSASI